MNFVRKKGVGKDFTLSSEFHESYIVHEDKKKIIHLKDGLQVELYAALINDFKTYGPTPLFHLHSKILFNEQTLNESQRLIRPGKKNLISFRDTEGNQIEFLVWPQIVDEQTN